MAEGRFFICRTNTPQGDVDYLSLLSPERGLIAEAVIGAVKVPAGGGEPRITLESFSRNATFVDLLQAVIRREAPKLATYRDEALATINGPVYVIDARAAGSDPVQPEDVFGAFEARDGKITPESYEANPTHRILSERGFFQLENALLELLKRELESLAAARSR